VMLESRALVAASLEKELVRFKDSVERRKSSLAADADLSYQSTLVAGADLPRVARQFEQLTWQVRIFISAKGIRYDDKVPEMLDELVALHGAIVGQRAAEAEHLWREKFERWVSDMVDQLAGGFDRDVTGFDLETWTSRRGS
jgi:DNA-binding GntR family transcriptional regulator